MSTLPDEPGDRPSRSRGGKAALIGGALGLLGALGLASLPLFNASSPGQLAGNLAFLLAYATPYLLALIAARAPHPGVRGGLLLAVGLLSFAASFSSLSLVTVVLLPATFVIWFAAARSLTAADRKLLTVVPSTVAGLLISATAAFGFFALFGVQEPEPQCWALVQSPDGASRWEARPNLGGPGELSLALSGGESRGHCASDVITNTEAAITALALAVSVLGMAAVVRWLPTPDRSG